MIDAWFGKVLDAIDQKDLWDSTAVIVFTDHGHFLGEKDIWGKPQVPAYEPLGHIPMMISWPGRGPVEISALTTAVDVFATLADLFGVVPLHQTHGKSLIPLINGEAKSLREWLLCGVWGREVHVVNERIKYARAPSGENAPLSLWSNRWSTMPIHAAPGVRLPPPDDRAFLDKMPASKIPVIRQPFDPSDSLPYWAMGGFRGNYLFDLESDPAEDRNLAGSNSENEAADLLRAALDSVEAPGDQYRRLGIE